MNPVTKTTTISENGEYSIEVREYMRGSADENITVFTGTIQSVQVREIANLAIRNGFFDITKNDMQMCIADSPTKSLEITFGQLSGSVHTLGAECEKEKLRAAYELIGKIETLIE